MSDKCLSHSGPKRDTARNVLKQRDLSCCHSVFFEQFSKQDESCILIYNVIESVSIVEGEKQKKVTSS